MKPNFPDWMLEFPGAITVCDSDGTIIYMNQKSCKTFEKYGGSRLIGTNLANCHPEPARSKLIELLQAGRTNVYTIEKLGVKKMVYQSPWFDKGEYMGFVELSLEIPFDIPHFTRQDPETPC